MDRDVVGNVDGSSNRAASFTVGCTARVRPTRRPSPERWSSAGVWIAPPHTTTWAKSTVAARPSAVETSARVARSSSTTRRWTRWPVRRRAPADSARGRYVSVMLRRRPSRASGPRRSPSTGGSRRGASRGRPRLAVCLARRRVGAGDRLHGELPFDLVADRVQVDGVEIGDAVAGAPTVDDLLRRATVETAVDLGTASGAAPFGVGDGGPAEGDGDAAGAVLAVHLLEREGVTSPWRTSGPSSRTSTSNPASARIAAVGAPPAPDPTTSTSASSASVTPALPVGEVSGHESHTWARASERTSLT